ncbi:MAG: VanZ family protein [Bacteroidota bacterium]
MNKLKKIVVLLPVVIVSCIFLRVYYLQQYENAKHNRLLALIITILLFYAWVIAGIIRRRQNSFFDILVQSTYYVYIFSVLTLTGYFILFNQVSAHDWWHKMIERVNRREGVNLQPFTFMKGHRLFTYDVVGNFMMLMPLGIYLPMLYKNIKGFFSVTFVAMMVSVSIELMQLATNVRIADINDVILNTAGASVGFIIYFIIYALFIKPLNPSRKVQAYS